MANQHFYTISDFDLSTVLAKANEFKATPFKEKSLKGKTIITIYLNPSLRTRLSTEKAAHHLGLQVVSLNISDAWKWETELRVKMDLDKAEHIKDAAKVISQYCDLIAIRAFPGLQNQEIDQADIVLNSFKRYASVPIVNLESAGGHPLQAIADAMTIQEHRKSQKPKVVLSWAPHPKQLPHAVPTSFARMANLMDFDFTIVHPKGYELSPDAIGNAIVGYDQNQALKDADFVYVKNWSSTKNYGQVMCQDSSWMIDQRKMQMTNDAHIMHCLPVRRNVVIADSVLDSTRALHFEQANNRTFAAQSVLWYLLSN